MTYSYLTRETFNCDFNVEELHYQKIVKLKKFLSEFENVEFYDITETICPSGRCIMNPNKVLFMYIDGGYLSVDGAAHVFGEINVKFY